MPVIKTKSNRVVADEPEQDDLYVRVTWHGPDDDGRHMRAFDGPILPVEGYSAAVAWAVGIADQMRFPLYVVPLRGRDALADERLRRGAAALTAQERGDLRRFVVAQLAEVMRDCEDADVRADAYEVLVGLRAVQP